MPQKTSVKVSEVVSKPYISNKNVSSVNEKFKTLDIPDEKTQKLISNNITSELGEEHPFDYSVVEGITKKFGLVNAIVEKITDFTIGPGVYIESEDEGIVEILETWMRETCFKHYLRPWSKEALIKGCGYLEIAGLGKKNIINTIKVVNANQMYVKKDEYGNVKGYTQYLGNNYLKIDGIKKIDLSSDEIVQLDFNKIGTCAYGYGIVFSALETIDYFLSANQSMHTIMRRKANSQVHWKLGNAEKEDYPKQEDIDAFAGKLQFMNDTTEFVTGPNADAKVIDFGNIGEKFAEVLSNDYKLLSYCFQVPEMLLGSDRGWSGSSEVQLDAFERSCKSKQEEIGFILKEKIFNKILEANGVTEFEYEVVWGQPSEDDKLKELETFRELLKIPGLNAGLFKAIEKKVAYTLDIDYDEVYEEPEESPIPTDSEMPENPQMPMEEPEEPEEDEEEMVENKYGVNDFIEKLKTNLKGTYGQDIEHSLLSHKQESLDKKDYSIKEYLNKEYKSYKDKIIEFIKKDDFKNIFAENKVELTAGYLSKSKLNKFKKSLIEGIENDMSLKKIKEDVMSNVKIKNLYEYNKKGLIKNEDGKKILLLGKDERTEMIVKTELTRVSNEGFLEASKDEGVKLVEWITADDERVCPICGDLDNGIFEVKSLKYQPPVHVNCRCHLEKVDIAETMKITTCILEDKKLAPQEKEAKLMKFLKVDEVALQKIIDSYNKLKK